MLILRWILVPFSVLYGLLMEIRNMAYEKKIFSTYIIPGKAIVVGNLSTGGTGKTPHVHYLATYLKDHFPVCIVSRGYGRKTKGLLEVKENNTASEVGDEPLFYKKRFGDTVEVLVSEDRKKAIQLTENKEVNTVFLLDDAYQHRSVKAGLSIVLTEFEKPYFNDFVLPTGNLREFAWNVDRASLVLVTKCPADLDDHTKNSFIRRLKCAGKPVFFTRIKYGEPVSFERRAFSRYKKLLLVTGIANPQPLISFCKERAELEMHSFPDHHEFSMADIRAIHQKFDTFAQEDSIILTTEKDYVRMGTLISNGALKDYPWFYLPISLEIDREEEFKSIIDQYVGAI